MARSWHQLRHFFGFSLQSCSVLLVWELAGHGHPCQAVCMGKCLICVQGAIAWVDTQWSQSTLAPWTPLNCWSWEIKRMDREYLHIFSFFNAFYTGICYTLGGILLELPFGLTWCSVSSFPPYRQVVGGICNFHSRQTKEKALKPLYLSCSV